MRIPKRCLRRPMRTDYFCWPVDWYVEHTPRLDWHEPAVPRLPLHTALACGSAVFRRSCCLTDDVQTIQSLPHLLQHRMPVSHLDVPASHRLHLSPETWLLARISHRGGTEGMPHIR